MAAYATTADVEARLGRTFDTAETNQCGTLLDDAAVIIDAFAPTASADIKELVSCRMVMRALDVDGAGGVPMGATQGSASALGYSQSWTISAGGSGELYLSKLEKQLLGVGNQIGSYSPVENLVPTPDEVGALL